MNPASPWPSDGWFETLLPWLRALDVEVSSASADFTSGNRRLTIAGTLDANTLGFALSLEGAEFRCRGKISDVQLAVKGLAKWLSGDDFRIGGIEVVE